MRIQEFVKKHVNNLTHSEATVESYKVIAARFGRETGIKNLEDLGAREAKEKIYTWKLKVLDRASGTTWNTYRRHLSALANSAIRWGYIKKNPFKELGSVRETHKIKTISEQELNQVLMAVKIGQAIQPATFWEILIRFIYATGLRRRQVIGLRWRHVNFTSQTILIEKKFNKNKVDAIVPISKTAIDLLKQYSQHYPARTNSGQVFNITKLRKNYVGTEMTEDHITQGFRRISRKTGVRISAHRLRHTFATRLANTVTENQNGGTPVQLKTLQELMTHSDIRTTCIYIHPSLSAQRALLEQLPKL